MSLLGLLEEKGRSLIIAGPQGSGKTLLARQLAETVDNTRWASLDAFQESKFTPWLVGAPDVVIVECDGVEWDRDVVLARTVPAMSVCVRKHHPDEEVPTPQYVFCMSGRAPGMPDEDRRFHILHFEGAL